MIAIATSLLFGLAASVALVVVWMSVRTGVAAGMMLLAGLEPARRKTQQRAPENGRGLAIFPAEPDRGMAARRVRPQRVGA